ncbi:MAG: hypothetical protein ACI85I_001831 [Arenicella sp.]|jgi:hypothetical protein
MPKRLYITLGLAVIGGLLLLWYANLGGFEDPKIEQVDKKAVKFIGRAHKGFPSDSEVGGLFKEIRQQIEEGRLIGNLNVVYFGNPDQHEEPIEIFVGVEVKNEASEAPTGLEIRKIEAGKVARAIVNAYSVVSPNPNKINEMLKESLEGTGLKPSDIYMERYRSEKEIWTEVYLK